MARGEFRLATQSGSRGFYGVVTLDVEGPTSDGAVSVEFDRQCAEMWQLGARFGIDYVLERISTRSCFPKGGRIIVRSIVGQPVDTSNLTIAYVAAEALLQALGIQTNKRPNIDLVNGVYSFPCGFRMSCHP